MNTIRRWGLFLVLLAFTVLWAGGDRSIPPKIATRLASPAKDSLDEMTRSFRQTDPETANALQNIRDTRCRQALAAVLSAESERPGGRKWERVGHLAQAPEQQWDYRLASMALDPERFSNQDQRREFLIAQPRAEVCSGLGP